LIFEFGGAPVSLARNSAAAEKNWIRKARAGKNSFPPTPFLFARPSDWISEFAVRIFVKKSSDFNQKAPPILRIRIAKFDAQKNFAQSLEYPDWKKSFGEGRGRIRL